LIECTHVDSRLTSTNLKIGLTNNNISTFKWPLLHKYSDIDVLYLYELTPIWIEESIIVAQLWPTLKNIRIIFTFRDDWLHQVLLTR
jgi:hypothetical protein